MFGFLKKKEAPVINDTLYAVATGKLIPITEVKDPVFSQKMMGDGFAIIPENGEIYAPVEGEVLSVFQTKHAIGMKMSNGLEVLLHMGIDTVELNGGPFDIKVSDGSKVNKGTLVAVANLDEIKAAGKETDMIVVITNSDAAKLIELTKTGEVVAGDEVGQAKA